MKRIPAWLTYTVLRLVFLFVPFGIMLALGMPWLLAIFIATGLAFALSLLVLRRPREATAISLYQARERRKSPAQSAEEAAEDAHADEVREAFEQQQRNRAAALDAETGIADDAASGNREG